MIYRSGFNISSFYTLLCEGNIEECRALQQREKGPAGELYRADIEFETGNFSDALSIYKELQNSSPDESISLESAISIYAVSAMTGEYKTAFGLERDLDMSNGDNFLYLYYKAKLNIITGFYDRAFEVSDTLMKLFPGDGVSDAMVKVHVMMQAVDLNIIKGKMLLVDGLIAKCDAIIKENSLENSIPGALLYARRCEYYRIKCDYAESLEAGLHAEEIFLQHPDFAEYYAECCFLISVPLLMTGDYRKASSYIKKSADIRERIFNEGNYVLIQSYCMIAECSKAAGDWESASGIYDVVIEKYKKGYNENHPEFLTLNFNYSTFLAEKGKYIQAKDLLIQIVPQLEAGRNSYNPELVEVYRGLAVILHILDDYEEAEEWFNKAIDLCETAIGENSSKYFSVVSDYAALLRDVGESDEAERLLRNAVSRLDEIGDVNQDDYLNAVDDFSKFLFKQQKYAESVFWQKKILVRLEKSSADKRLTASAYNSISKSYFRLGLFEMAEESARYAIDTVKGIEKSGNPARMDAMLTLGESAMKLGRYKEAVDLFRGVLEIQGSDLFETTGNSFMWNMQYTVAKVCSDMGDYQAALDELDKIDIIFYRDNLKKAEDVIELRIDILNRGGRREEGIVFIDKCLNAFDQCSDDAELLFAIRLQILKIDILLDKKMFDAASVSIDDTSALYNKLGREDLSMQIKITERRNLMLVLDNRLTEADFDDSFNDYSGETEPKDGTIH